MAGEWNVVVVRCWMRCGVVEWDAGECGVAGWVVVGWSVGCSGVGCGGVSCGGAGGVI